jgi:hypothetical protein
LAEKIMKTTLKSALLAVGLAVAATGGAHAASVSGTCNAGNKFVSLFSVEANDSSNVFCQAGNPDYSESAGTPTLTFGTHTFTLAYKSVAGIGSSQEKGDSAYTFSSFLGGTSSGTWSLSAAPSESLKLLVGIKQGTSYAAFLVNAQSGTWFTANGPTSSPGTGVSHYDLWYLDSTTPVPLPAAGWMLIAGIGGIAAMKRRKKT